MPQIIPTAEPFFFPEVSTRFRQAQPGSSTTGSEVGILLVHGFTGAPTEMRWLGEYLNREHGFTCLGVRLSGHATRPEDMIRSSYTDWLASVEDGYHLLAGMVDSIYLMGLSMGGVLTLTAASYLPVKGLVTMSTPYKLPDDPRLRHIEWISKFAPYLPKTSQKPGSSWFDKEAFKSHIAYPENPTHAISELNKLIGVMQTSLPIIKAPILLIHSRDDHYVYEESMPRIYEQIGSAQKQMLWIEGSGHVITRDAKRQQVFAAAADFVKRFEAENA